MCNFEVHQLNSASACWHVRGKTRPTIGIQENPPQHSLSFYHYQEDNTDVHLCQQFT